MEITKEQFLSILDYNEETGVFTWKYNSSMIKNWNTKYAGKVAGCMNKKGYVIIHTFKKYIKAHRIAFFLHHGSWPESIDHENHVKHDNRIANLKASTPQKQLMNLSMSQRNTSGSTGVHFDKKSNKWMSTIRVKGQKKFLGSFRNIKDAIAARQKANIEFNYHPNHGKNLATN